MKPPIPITDKRFIYTPSHSTDVRKTFERIRRELRGADRARVTELKRRQP